MSKEAKHHLLIPALIAAIAAYFGFRRKSETLSEIAKDLVGRAIHDQTEHNRKVNQRRVSHRPRHRLRRNLRDRYYS